MTNKPDPAIAAIHPPIPDRFDARECLAGECASGDARSIREGGGALINSKRALRAITTAHQAGIAEGLERAARAVTDLTEAGERAPASYFAQHIRSLSHGREGVGK